MGLLSFAAAGVDKLRIVIDSERRERLEAEEQSAPCLRSRHVNVRSVNASMQRGTHMDMHAECFMRII